MPRPIVSFVLPLGYSFNLDGTHAVSLRWRPSSLRKRRRCTLTIGQQITMMLTLMLTSKGVAGVPRASLVILAAHAREV